MLLKLIFGVLFGLGLVAITLGAANILFYNWIGVAYLVAGALLLALAPIFHIADEAKHITN